jgi:hypothetical protein
MAFVLNRPGDGGFVMRVVVNGRPADQLEASIERQLVSGSPHARVEGAVMGADEAVAATARNLRILYGVLCGLAAVIMLGVLIGVGAYEPRDLVWLVPFVLLLGGGLGLFMRFTYRRNTGKVRQRAVEQLPRMPPTGAVVVVEADGLGIGQDRYAWSALAVGAIDVSATTFNDAPLNLIERLELEGAAGRPLVLDAVLISNGRAVVDEIWRRLRAPR